MGTQNSSPFKRTLGLDVLRFVAVSLVLFRHTDSFQVSEASGHGWILGFKLFADGLHRVGWVGVDIFFVLSGFLVSGLLFREWQQRGGVSIGRFLLRRGFKIYPAFWFFLSCMLVFKAVNDEPISGRGLLGEILFLQNCWDNLFFHTWSLAVEEHFYLLVALGTWLILRLRSPGAENPFKIIPKVFLVVAVTCLLVRIVSCHVFPLNRTRLLFFGTHVRIDALFFGLLLSYLWHFYFTARHHHFFEKWRWGFVIVGMGLLYPMAVFDTFKAQHIWIHEYGFVLCYLAGGALLIGFLKIFEHTTMPVARFVGFLGANSYSVYLWHMMGVLLAVSIFPPGENHLL